MNNQLQQYIIEEGLIKDLLLSLKTEIQDEEQQEVRQIIIQHFVNIQECDGLNQQQLQLIVSCKSMFEQYINSKSDLIKKANLKHCLEKYNKFIQVCNQASIKIINENSPENTEEDFMEASEQILVLEKDAQEKQKEIQQQANNDIFIEQIRITEKKLEKNNEISKKLEFQNEKPLQVQQLLNDENREQYVVNLQEQDISTENFQNQKAFQSIQIKIDQEYIHREKACNLDDDVSSIFEQLENKLTVDQHDLIKNIVLNKNESELNYQVSGEIMIQQLGDLSSKQIKSIKDRLKEIFHKGYPNPVKQFYYSKIEELGQINKEEIDPNFTNLFIQEASADYQNLKQQNDDRLIVGELLKQIQQFDSFNIVLKPYIFDVFKRRQSIKILIQMLKKKAQNQQFQPQNFNKMIEVFTPQDLFIILINQLSQKSQVMFSQYYQKIQYPMIIFAKTTDQNYTYFSHIVLPVLISCQKIMILNIGTKNCIQKGKTKLIQKLFSINDDSIVTRNEGITHNGSIQTYTEIYQYEFFQQQQNPKNQFKILLSDIQGYDENQNFLCFINSLAKFSFIQFIHLFTQDFDANLNLKQNAIDFLNQIVKNNNSFFFVFLWGFYFEKDQSIEILNKTKKLYSNLLQVYQIPKENPQKSDERVEFIYNLREQIGLLIKQQFEQQESQQFFDVEEFTQLYNRNIIKFQEEQNVQNQNQSPVYDAIGQLEKFDPAEIFKKIFSFQFLEYKLTSLQKQIDKLFDELSHKIDDTNKHQEIKRIQQEVQGIKEQRVQTKLSSFILNVKQFLQSQDFFQIIKFGNQITAWKQKKLNPLINEYVKISNEEFFQQRQIIQNEQDELQNIKKQQNQSCQFSINKLSYLSEQIENYDISIDKIISEFILEQKYRKEQNQTDKIFVNNYIQSKLDQGEPIQLIDGKCLNFGNQVLKEIFQKDNQQRKVFVISIIGIQSSAKSTLLNYLFGCGFQTSAGRCTKGTLLLFNLKFIFYTGMYITAMHYQDISILILDTEGLLSADGGRDHLFDNQIGLMAFGISHIVLINNKGELNKFLQDLIQVSLYSMKAFKLETQSPRIIFTLRDWTEQKELSLDPKKQMLSQIIHILQLECSRVNLDFQQFIQIRENDIKFFPSAFIDQEEDGIKVTKINSLFSQHAYQLRQAILDYFQKDQNIKPYSTLISAYDSFERTWSTIQECGKYLLDCKNILEIKQKDELNKICMELLSDGLHNLQELFENEQQQEKENQISEEEFQIKLNNLTSCYCKQTEETFLIKTKGREFGEQKLKEQFIQIIQAQFNSQKVLFMGVWKSERKKTEIEKKFDQFFKTIDDKIDIIVNKYSQNKEEALTEIKNYYENLKVNEINEKLTQIEKEKQTQIALLKSNIQQQINNLHQSELNKNPQGEQIFTQQINIHKYEENFLKMQEEKKKDNNKKCSNKGDQKVKNTSIEQIFDKKWLKKNLFEKFINIFKKEEFVYNGDEMIKQIQEKTKNYLKQINDITENQSKDRKTTSEVQKEVKEIFQLTKNIIQKEFQELLNQNNYSDYLFLGIYYYFQILENTQQEQSETFKRKINEKIEKKFLNIKEQINSSGDAFTLGKQISDQFFPKLQKLLVDQLEQNAIKLLMHIQATSTITNPESANKAAYEQAFNFDFQQGNRAQLNQQKAINIAKFCLNTNKFVKEIFKKNAESSLNNYLSKDEIGKLIVDFVKLRDAIEYSTANWVKLTDKYNIADLKLIILKIIEDYQDKPYLFKNFNSEILQDFRSFNCNNKNQFKEGFFKSLKIQQNMQTNLTEIFKRKFKEKLKLIIQDAIGCKEKCPYCNAKCETKKTENHSHKVSFHRYQCFRGWRDQKTKEPTIICCTTQDAHNRHYCKYEKRNIEEYCQENFIPFDNHIVQYEPMWRESIPEQINASNYSMNNEQKKKLNMAWQLTRNFFVEYYNLKDYDENHYLFYGLEGDEKPVDKELIKKQLTKDGYI